MFSELGTPLTRAECDGCLMDLALVLPRADLDGDQIERMSDLYFGLLREAGVTKQMLVAAAKAYVMAPTKGKPRFFPDPGQLAELCADAAKERRMRAKALKNCVGIVSGEVTVEREDGDVAPDMREKLRAVAENFRVYGAPTREDRHPIDLPRSVNTSRPKTDAGELKNHVNKTIGRR
jgi:hypothetical protein